MNALRVLAAISAVVLLSWVDASARPAEGQPDTERGEIRIAAARKPCKQVYTCEEAVILWCSGYSRADGDGDGIPCENVCHSRRQVDAIRREIGC